MKSVRECSGLIDNNEEIRLELFEESMLRLGYSDMVININGEDLGPGDLQSIIDYEDVESMVASCDDGRFDTAIDKCIIDLVNFKQ